MRKKKNAAISPKCAYCAYGRSAPDGLTVLCPKKGIMDAGSACRKYKYDILKRQPMRRPPLQAFQPEDFEL